MSATTQESHSAIGYFAVIHHFQRHFHIFKQDTREIILEGRRDHFQVGPPLTNEIIYVDEKRTNEVARYSISIEADDSMTIIDIDPHSGRSTAEYFTNTEIGGSAVYANRDRTLELAATGDNGLDHTVQLTYRQHHSREPVVIRARRSSHGGVPMLDHYVTLDFSIPLLQQNAMATVSSKSRLVRELLFTSRSSYVLPLLGTSSSFSEVTKTTGARTIHTFTCTASSSIQGLQNTCEQRSIVPDIRRLWSTRSQIKQS